MGRRMFQRRGLIANLPTLNVAEFGFATDAGAQGELYIGTATGNLKVFPPVISGAAAISGTPVANQFTYWVNATDVGGLPQVTWDSGNTRLALANTVGLQWTGRSILTSPDDGSLRLTNSAANDAQSLYFGPGTAAFPQLKRNGAGLQLRDGTDALYGTFEAGQTALDAGVYTVSGADDKAFNLQATLNDPTPEGGTQEFRLIKANLSVTSSVGWDVVRLLDLQVDGVTQFNVTTGGALTAVGGVATDDVTLNNDATLSWAGRSVVTSPFDGNVLLRDSALTSFGLLQFGSTGSGAPALKPSGTALQVRLADDSGFANIQPNAVFAADTVQAGSAAGKTLGWQTKSKLLSPSDGVITLTNNLGTDFGLLQFGGATSGHPALGRSGAGLEVRLADGSGYATLTAFSLVATGQVAAAGGNVIRWSGRSVMSAPVDGDLLLQDGALADFGLLQFGGTTSGFPAIKRSGGGLVVRQADDLADAGLTALTLTATQNAFLSAGAKINFGGGLRSRISSDVDGDVLLTDSSNTTFNLLQFGGTTSAFPGIGRDPTDTDAVACRLADDSSYATLYALALSASTDVLAATSFRWPLKSRIQSPSDGTITLLDDAETSFTSLNFGGNTAAAPSLRRDGTELECKLADNSGFAPFVAGSLASNTFVAAATASYVGWSGAARLYTTVAPLLKVRDSTNTVNCNVEMGSFLSEGPVLTASGTDDYGAFIRRTLNDPSAEGGTQTFTLLKGDISVTDDTGWDNVFLADLQVDGASKFSIADTGNTVVQGTLSTGGNIRPGATVLVQWQGRTALSSPADGDLLATNSTASSPGCLRQARFVEQNAAGVATPNALGVLESFKVFTNETATALNYHNLPTAEAGIQYTFVVQDSDGIRVNAAAGDTIRVAASVSGTGGFLQSTTVGDAITVVAINATEWVAINQVGTGWAVT